MSRPSFFAIPATGKKIEFWPHRMKQMHDERGILGRFKDGSFYSEDMADHWSVGEIQGWAYV